MVLHRGHAGDAPAAAVEGPLQRRRELVLTVEAPGRHQLHRHLAPVDPGDQGGGERVDAGQQSAVAGDGEDSAGVPCGPQQPQETGSRLQQALVEEAGEEQRRRRHRPVGVGDVEPDHRAADRGRVRGVAERRGEPGVAPQLRGALGSGERVLGAHQDAVESAPGRAAAGRAERLRRASAVEREGPPGAEGREGGHHRAGEPPAQLRLDHPAGGEAAAVLDVEGSPEGDARAPHARE